MQKVGSLSSFKSNLRTLGKGARLGVAITIFNGLGDSILARPFLAKLTKVANVTLYCYSGQEELFGGLKLNIVGVDPRKKLPLSCQRPELWISLNAYSPIPLERTFHKRWRGVCRKYFGQSVRDTSKFFILNKPMTKQFGIIGGVSSSFLPWHSPVEIPYKTKNSVNNWLNMRPHQALCVIHGDTVEGKMWPVKKWEALVDRILQLDILVVSCGKDTKFLQHMGIRNSSAELDLIEQFSILRQADLFVGVDSVFMHVADSFKCHGVALFGPTNPKVWGPQFSGLRPVWDGSRRMSCLAVDSVWRQFEKAFQMRNNRI